MYTIEKTRQEIIEKICLFEKEIDIEPHKSYK